MKNKQKKYFEEYILTQRSFIEKKNPLTHKYRAFTKKTLMSTNQLDLIFCFFQTQSVAENNLVLGEGNIHYRWEQQRRSFSFKQKKLILYYIFSKLFP